MIQTYESRYLTAEAILSGDVLFLDDRVPYRYRSRDDTVLHTAAEGESWATIAQKYYTGISSRACGLWWVIAEFQPQPVVDPTLAIAAGRVIHVPSPLVVQTDVLGVTVTEYL